MKNILLPVFIILLPAAVLAGVYHGSYVDGSGVYSAPSSVNTYKDGSPWTPGNAAFASMSTITGPNVPGQVGVTLANVTTAGDYAVIAKDSAGSWHTLELRREPQAGITAEEVWSSPSRTVTGGTVGSVTNPVALAMASYTGIDARLSQRHGPGAWGGSSTVNVLPFQGSVSYETASFGADIHVVRGDSVAIPFSAGMDITGWSVWFGAKANPADTAYAIGPVDVSASVTDAAAGTGLIELSSVLTDIAPRRYFAEIELRGQGQKLTPLRFYLWIDADVVR